uniref:Uncharacterized protein n=1 Tax=Clastoptera arizonana TaxID=38151 RepID=A0A1B6CVZ7_9HEMI
MNNFDKIRRHSSLGNKKSDNSILKLEENDFDLLDVVPFVKNVEKVYKLDPIDGKIVLENITKVIKKRNDIVNSLTDIKKAASHQGNVSNSNNVDFINEPKYIVGNFDNHKLIRKKRHLNTDLQVYDYTNLEKDSFKDRLRNGWENLFRSKIMKSSSCETTESTSSKPTTRETITESYSDTQETKPENENQINGQVTTPNPFNNRGDVGSEIGMYLSGRLSEILLKEIFDRLPNLSKLKNDLGIGHNSKNITSDKCFPQKPMNNLISPLKGKKSMNNFNLMISNKKCREKCYDVPPVFKLYYKYLMEVNSFRKEQKYNRFRSTDISIVFKSNFSKDVCPDNCKNDETYIQEDSIHENNKNTKEIQEIDELNNNPENIQTIDKADVSKTKKKIFDGKYRNKEKSAEINQSNMNIRNKKTLLNIPKDIFHNFMSSKEEKAYPAYNEYSKNLQSSMDSEKKMSDKDIYLKQIHPDSFNNEKVKAFKGKLNNIIYADTPHFETPVVN